MANLVSIILILASVGLFLGYINPTYTADTGSLENTKKSVKELQVEEKDYQDAINKTKEIERIRDSLNDKFKTIQKSDVDKLSKLLPDHIDSVRLIIDINNIANRFGMSLRNISLSVSGAEKVKTTTPASQTSEVRAPGNSATGIIGPDDKKFGSAQLTFSVFGSYENFAQFLREMERSLRIVDVTSLSFKASGSTESFGAGSKANNFLNTSKVPTKISVGDNYEYTMTIRTYYLK